MLAGCFSFSVAEMEDVPEPAVETEEIVETAEAAPPFEPETVAEETANEVPEEPVADEEAVLPETSEDGFIPCPLTEGCTLEAGHEGECVVPQEETDEPLPYGFTGLPEGYTLSSKQLASKASLRDHDVPAVAENIQEGKDFVKGEILFSAKDREEADLFAKAYNAELLSFRHGIGRAKLNGEATVAQAVACGADERLRLPAVEPNYIVRLDPVKSTADKKHVNATVSSVQAPEKTTWADYNDSDPFLKDPQRWDYQWQHDTANSYEAWSVTKGAGVIVAVLDTGIDASHPDLAGKVTPRDGDPVDEDGHGTHVAGIIGAILGNEEGGSGIAPKATLYTYNVLPDEGSGTTEDICQGIYDATDDGAYIISMSLGSYWYSGLEEEAINYAYEHKVTVVAAMGNDGSNTVSYPAFYNHVIAVGAVDRDGTRAFFSNYGKWCDISAPGVDILSTIPDGLDYGFSDGEGTYAYMSGTSQATPVVSGVLALYMSKAGKVGHDTALAKLKKCATKCKTKEMGAGIIDASKLFEQDKLKPTIVVKNGGTPITSFKAAVPYGSTFELIAPETITDEAEDERGKLVWSVGSKLVLKDGEVADGTEYAGAIELKAWAGKKITIYAAYINGMGVMSTVASVTLTVSANPSPASVTVSAPQMLFSGKSATLTASVSPADSAQTVTWSIVLPANGSAVGTKISANGVLTAKASAVCTVNVTAKVKENPAISRTVPIVLRPAETRKVVLATSTLRVEKGNSVPLFLTGVGVYKVDGKTETLIDPDLTPAEGGYELAVSSSNSNVVSVGEDNTLQAVGNGTAKISVSLKDGSAKAAVLNVTVVTLANEVKITGPEKAVAGKSLTLKAEVMPSTASDKAVTWAVTNGPAKISANGILTINKDAAPGSYVRVTATAKDGTNRYGVLFVDIIEAPTYFCVEYDEDKELEDQTTYGVTCKYNSKGSLAEVTLLTLQLPASKHQSEEDWAWKEDELPVAMQLLRGTDPITGADLYSQVSVSSSNTKVATVDPDGTIHAAGAGTANVTYALTDGSGQKITVKVIVRVPASSLAITSSAMRMIYDTPTLAAGSSVTHKVTFGDGFGKPSTTAANVCWGFELTRWDDDQDDYVPVEDPAALKQVVLNPKTGKLTLKKGISRYGEYMQIRVWANTTDGSCVQDSFLYDIVDYKGSKIILHWKLIYAYKGDYEWNEFYSDAFYWDDVTVTSSNPEVASLWFSGMTDEYDNWVDYPRVYFACNKVGTAKITIQLNDGSNRKASFTVKVTDY